MSWDGINPLQMFKVGFALYYFMAKCVTNPVSRPLFYGNKFILLFPL